MWRSYLKMTIWAAPLAILLALAVYLPLRRRARKRRTLQTTRPYELCLALFVAYLAGVAALVFSSGSLYMENTFATVAERLQTGEGINLVPLYTLRQVFTGGAFPDIINLAANVAMFVPLGFLLPLLFPCWRRWYKAVPLAFAASACIETVQLFIGRSVDVDDVLLNTLGAAIGYVVWRLTGGGGKCGNAEKRKPE